MDVQDKINKLLKLQELSKKLKSNILNLENNLTNSKTTSNINYNYLDKGDNYLEYDKVDDNLESKENKMKQNENIKKKIKDRILELKKFEINLLEDLKEVNMEKILELQKKETDKEFLKETLTLCEDNISYLENEKNLDKKINTSRNKNVKKYLELSNLNKNKIRTKNENYNISKNKSNTKNKIIEYTEEQIENFKKYNVVNEYFNSLENEDNFVSNKINCQKLNLYKQLNMFNNKMIKYEDINLDEDTEEKIESFMDNCYFQNCQIIDLYLNLAEKNDLSIPNEKKIKAIKNKLDGYIYMPKEDIDNLYKHNFIKYLHIKNNVISIKYGTIIKNNPDSLLLTFKFKYYWCIKKTTPIFKKISYQDLKQIIDGN